MKTLDELFDKAKNAPPPISETEAEEMILGAKKSPVTTRRSWSGKTSLWLLAAILALGITWLIKSTQPFSENTVTLSTTETSSIVKNDAVEKSVENKNHIQGQKSEGPHAPGAAELNPQALAAVKSGSLDPTTKENIPLFLKAEKMKPGNIKTKSKAPLIPVNKNSGPVEIASPPFGKTEAEQAGVELVQTKDIPAINIEQPKDVNNAEGSKGGSSVADSTVPAASTVLTDSVSMVKNNNVPAPELPAPFRGRNFIKTDLLGYTYTNLGAGVVGFSGYHIESTIRNRFAVGFEREISKRISLGLNAAYGMPGRMRGVSGSFSANSPAFEAMATNYKGLSLGLEARYYVLKGKRGSGIFAGPYMAYAFLQERIFTSIGNNAGEVTLNTISTSWGESGALGVFAGYKFVYRNFFLEPLIGEPVFGRDSKYFNQAIYGQESVERWRVLNRIELSAGYAF
jgi:hypothetical protein